MQYADLIAQNFAHIKVRLLLFVFSRIERRPAGTDQGPVPDPGGVILLNIMVEVPPLHATHLHLGMIFLTVIRLPGDTSHSTALLHAIIDECTA